MTKLGIKLRQLLGFEGGNYAPLEELPKQDTLQDMIIPTADTMRDTAGHANYEKEQEAYNEARDNLPALTALIRERSSMGYTYVRIDEGLNFEPRLIYRTVEAYKFELEEAGYKIENRRMNGNSNFNIKWGEANNEI